MAIENIYIGCVETLWYVGIGPEPGGDHKTYRVAAEDFDRSHQRAEEFALNNQGKHWKDVTLPDSLKK